METTKQQLCIKWETDSIVVCSVYIYDVIIDCIPSLRNVYNCTTCICCTTVLCVCVCVCVSVCVCVCVCACACMRVRVFLEYMCVSVSKCVYATVLRASMYKHL